VKILIFEKPFGKIFLKGTFFHFLKMGFEILFFLKKFTHFCTLLNILPIMVRVIEFPI